MKLGTLIDKMKIATPCPTSWDEMEGGERTRYCSLCRLNVYNISEMSSQEVVDLVMDKEGKVCVQLYRRADGRVLTRDCEGGSQNKSIAQTILETVAVSVGGLCEKSVESILRSEAQKKKQKEKEAEKKRLKKEKNKNRSRPFY